MTEETLFYQIMDLVEDHQSGRITKESMRFRMENLINDAMSEETGDFESDLDDAKQSLEDMEKEKDDLEEEWQNKYRSLEDRLEQEIDEHRTDKYNLEKELEGYREENQTLHENIEDLNSIIESLEGEK